MVALRLKRASLFGGRQAARICLASAMSPFLLRQLKSTDSRPSTLCYQAQGLANLHGVLPATCENCNLLRRLPPTTHFVDRALRTLSFRTGAVPFTLARIGVNGQLKSYHIVRLQFEGASKFFKGIVVLPFSEIVKTTKRDVLRHD